MSKRDLRVPFTVNTIREEIRMKSYLRVYLYWTPTTLFSLSTEYQFETLDRDFLPGTLTPDRPNNIKTQRLPFGLNFFHPIGFFANISPIYINQEVEFPNLRGGFRRGPIALLGARCIYWL